MNTDWKKFRSSFSQEQQDAIWQYLLDHSQIQKNGYWGIQLYVRDIDDLWKRVWARYSGEFVRYNKLEKQRVMDNQTFIKFKRMSERNTETAIEIKKNGTHYAKIMLWIYRRSRDYIQNYSTHGCPPPRKSIGGGTI